MSINNGKKIRAATVASVTMEDMIVSVKHKKHVAVDGVGVGGVNVIYLLHP